MPVSRAGILSGALEGLLEGGFGKVIHEGLVYSQGSQKGFLSREDISRMWICGSITSRSRMTMEVVLREAEAGEKHAILDLSGNYVPLIDYIPSLRIYRFGKYASINPFKPCCSQ